MRTVPLLAGALLASCAATDEPPPAWVPPGFQLVHRQDFSDPESMAELDFTDPEVWHRGSQGERSYLALEGASAYEPPVRSPTSLALLKEPSLRDFILEIDVQYTGRAYGHSDVCLVFDYEGPSRFYYVHLAPEPDDRAHNVFLVDDAPRRRIAEVPSSGLAWEPDSWRRIRLERVADSVRVFVDDRPEPVLEARDGTIASGRVGFGSFDDSGRFTRLFIWARESEPVDPR